MLSIVDDVAPMLPAEQPRYLMGVGTPDDLLESIARGMDMFDCVLPTRNGRHGVAFSRFGPINLRNARHAADPRPLDEQSNCAAGGGDSRASLSPPIPAQKMLGAMLLSAINLAYYQELMAGIREAVAAHRLENFRREIKDGWVNGDLPIVSVP
jgi:queuine tRNA-ribosyltransferase